MTWLGRLLRDDSLVSVTELEADWGDWGATDAGLVHLQGLRRLKVLVLNNTEVGDAGLVHLQGLSQLQELWLAETQVTDAGLVHLQGLRQLQVLRSKTPTSPTPGWCISKGCVNSDG